MPRKARIDYPGLTHHVMSRSVDGVDLFWDDADRRFFLASLSQRLKESGFRCFGWVLMDTHYHLLLKTTDNPLWHMMKPLNTDYAHFYNKKHNRRGHLFLDRYKSIAAQDQYYLEQLVRYIHLNPLRAGVCKSISQLNTYPWSGHAVLMGKRKSDFQDTRSVLQRFGQSTFLARKNYLEFLMQGMSNPDDELIFIRLRRSNNGAQNQNDPACWVIGDADFQKSVLEKDRQNRLNLTRCKKEGWSLDQMAEMVAEKMGVSKYAIMEPSKRTVRAAARMVFCSFAREFGFRTRDIGRFLKISQAAVSNSARKGVAIARDKGITYQ